MTDKQIIIDGVDVRKCVNRRWDNSQKIHLCYDSDTPLTSWGWCENNPNCYYKQLKAKEQKCESWKTLINEAQLEQRKLEQQLDQLKATNEDLLNIQYKLADNNKQLRQTLAEIKEIINEFAKEDILTFPDFSKEKNYELIQKQCGEPILKILQTINKVEDE